MTSIGVPARHVRFNGPYDAIVVGSGIGGLAVAALLAKHARRQMLVLEQHYTAAGCTHTAHRKGFEWNVGVHYIGDVGHPKALMRVILDDIAAEPIEWASIGEIYDRIVLGQDVFDSVAGSHAFVERPAERFPEERTAIERYVELVRETERAVPAPVSAAVGSLMRRELERIAARTTREVLEELTSNQKLIAVLAGQFGDDGLPPARSSQKAAPDQPVPSVHSSTPPLSKPSLKIAFGSSTSSSDQELNTPVVKLGPTESVMQSDHAPNDGLPSN